MKNCLLVCIKNLSVVIGITLMAINLSGLIVNNPGVPAQDRLGSDRRTISTNTDDLDRVNSESDIEYFSRLSRLIDNHMIHFWVPDSEFSRINIFDNYLMFAASNLERFKRFNNYEFMTPRLALNRGYGYCSQLSKLTYAKLSENGFDARVFANDLHVIVVALSEEGKEHVIDSTYGIVIPHSIRELNENKELLSYYYQDQSAAQLEKLLAAYDLEFNEYFSIQHFEALERSEYLFYLMKWLIPLFFLLIYAYIKYRSTKQSSTLSAIAEST